MILDYKNVKDYCYMYENYMRVKYSVPQIDMLLTLPKHGDAHDREEREQD